MTGVEEHRITRLEVVRVAGLRDFGHGSLGFPELSVSNCKMSFIVAKLTAITSPPGLRDAAAKTYSSGVWGFSVVFVSNRDMPAASWT